MVTACWPQACSPRLAGSRRLMVKIFKTSPNYLTINQWKENPQPITLIPKVAFKTLPWKLMESLGFLSISCHSSWLGALQIHTELSFMTTQYQQISFAVLWASRLKFGSVTEMLYINFLEGPKWYFLSNCNKRKSSNWENSPQEFICFFYSNIIHQ